MMRRELFAFVLAFTAGIASGFFILERTELLRGTVFMLSCGIIPNILAESYHMHGDNDYDKKPEISRREIIILTCMITAGFLFFSSSYIRYESGLRYGGISGEQSIFDSVEGKVVSLTSAEEGYRIVLDRPTLTSFSNNNIDGKTVTEEGDPDSGGLRVNPPFRIMVRFYGESCSPEDWPGRYVRCRGTLKEIQPADNPGCFDYRVYMRSLGIGYAFKADSLEVISEHCDIGGTMLHKMYHVREDFLNMFDEDERGFIKGVIFGDKSEIDEETRDTYNINSTGHILAVSGLHIGFLYSLVRFLSGRRKDLPAALLTAFIIVAYGCMTMWSAATVRAVTVIICSLMSLFFRRRADLLTSVSLAAFLILISEPYQLFNAGFQMSFMALLGIAFLAKPFSHFLGSGTGTMLAVQTGTAPMAAWIFHRFNPLSILINIPIIALASVLVPFCMILLMLFIADIPVPEAAYDAASGLSDIINMINRKMAAGGMFSGLITGVNAGVFTCLYSLPFIICSEWARVQILRRHWQKIGLAALCILIVSLAAGAASYNTFADDEVVFVAVGQGDCTHIRDGPHDVLIDGGGSTFTNVGKNILMPYLLANGAERLDMALVTHLHTDHYQGISELDKEYPIGGIGIPDDYRQSVESLTQNGRPADDDEPDLRPEKTIFISPESCITISDDVYIEPIWPLTGGNTSISIDDPNEHNMVYMIHYRGIKIMVTGDLMEEDELKMVGHYRGTDTLKCDVLKVAHHGSKSSSSEEFLDTAAPSIAVIQVGRDNLYGHPHQQSLDRLSERGIDIYRTDLNGAVGIDIRKTGIKVDVMHLISRSL